MCLKFFKNGGAAFVQIIPAFEVANAISSTVAFFCFRCDFAVVREYELSPGLPSNLEEISSEQR
jgi:hypothetical protein